VVVEQAREEREAGADEGKTVMKILKSQLAIQFTVYPDIRADF